MADVQASNSSSTIGGIGYFEVGNFEPAPTIPGLNFVESTEATDKPKSKSKKSKNKGKSETGDNSNSSTGKAQQPAVPNLPSSNISSTSTATSSNQPQTDPNKRLRNLKKRLKEIEALEQRIASGELKAPEKEQVWNEYVYKMNSLHQL